MTHFSLDTIKTWERFYRANFINSLTGYKSANLIGTVNKEGQPNLAIFSSIVHLGSDPALIGYINRPIAAAPHTLANIEATGIYTINHVNVNMIEQAHQTSAKYAPEVNEFEAVGLTPIFKEQIIAPFVAESAVQYAMELVEIVPIKHNNTFLVIGAVTNVFIEENILGEDGFLSLDKASSCSSNGVDAYYLPTPIGRYAYAKPNVPVKNLIS